MSFQKITVTLGTLGLQEKFMLPGSSVIYNTITYPKSFVNTKLRKRECLNLTTLKAAPMACKERVIRIVS